MEISQNSPWKIPGKIPGNISGNIPGNITGNLERGTLPGTWNMELGTSNMEHGT